MIDLGACASEAEAVERLRAECLRFLRAGGRFTWADWSEMDDALRTAAEQAGAELAGENAVTAAYALAELQREGVERARMSRALDAAAKRLESGEIRGRR